ncbi:hypothetical protein DFH06DRAFT_1122169 [Mycena polygramma]|nr:hypothetical protein DFH06DRAFT_1122169 [Mycena polygramma]
MFSTTTTTTTNLREPCQRRFSVDVLLNALPSALAPKRPRSASVPTPPRPTAVPRKSALKQPRALLVGDLDSSSSVFHIEFPSTASASDEKQGLSDEVKLALSLEARLARDSTLDNVLDTVSAYVPRTVSKLFKRTPSRAYWQSHDECRASAVRRNSNLPPPAEWDEVSVTFQSEVESDSDSEEGEAPTCPSTPRTVRFCVPAPPAPEPEPEYEEPVWSDFMFLSSDPKPHKGKTQLMAAVLGDLWIWLASLFSRCIPMPLVADHIGDR